MPWRFLGINDAVLIAGLAGGIASLMKQKKLSFWEKVITVLSGGFAANYLTPMVAEWVNFSENTHFGIAFMIGYGGMTFVEVIFLAIHKKFDSKKQDE